MEEIVDPTPLPVFKVAVTYADGTMQTHAVPATSGIEAAAKVPTKKDVAVTSISVIGVKNKRTLEKSQPKFQKTERQQIRMTAAKIRDSAPKKEPKERKQRSENLEKPRSRKWNDSNQ